MIALLGGSFNPPHLGHAHLCRLALARPDVEQVWLVPVARHPGGKQLAPFDERLEMCRRLAQDVDPRVSVSTAERELQGRGFTVDLLRHLAVRHPRVRFALLLGSDTAEIADRWPGWAEIERISEVIVVPRIAADAHGTPLSSTEVRRRIAAGEAVAQFLTPQVSSYLAYTGCVRRADD